MFLLEDLFLFLENSCVLCPWPREGLSSESWSLALDFFVAFALASSLVSSTPLLLPNESLRNNCDIFYNDVVLIFSQTPLQSLV